MGPDGKARTRAPAEFADSPSAARMGPQEPSGCRQPGMAEILAALPHPVFWKDRDGVYLGCNDAFARAVGLGSAAEIAGKTDFDLPWSRAEAEACRADDRAVIESGRPSRRTVEALQWPEGTRPRVDTTKVPLLTEDGRVYGVLGVCTDITDGKRVAEEGARLTAILESTSDLVGAWTPDGRVTYLNAAGRRLVGWDASEDPSGHRMSEIHPAWAWELIRQEGIPATLERGVWQGGTAVLNREGREIPVSQVITAHHAANGELQYLSTTVRDITEGKRAAARLRRQMEATERLNALPVGRDNRIFGSKERINRQVAATGRGSPYDAVHADAEAPAVDGDASAAERQPPAEEPEPPALAELLALGPMQRLLDSFCDAVGNAAAIIDLEGNVLVKARWQRLCTDFHRVNQATRARCIESDTVLASRLEEGERFSLYQCRNGLTDAASPIVIEGRHVANVFVGQFLLEPPDGEFFRRQAAEFSFDETAYLDALRQVPIVPREKLPAVLSFLTGCAELVVSMGLERLRGHASEARLKQRAEELDQVNRELLRQRTATLSLAKERDRLFNLSIDMLCIADFDGRLKQVNPAWTRALGWGALELTQTDGIDFVHPDDRPATIAAGERLRQGQEVRSFENRYRCKDGGYRWLSWNAYPLTEQELIFAVCRDVTESKAAQEEHARLEAQLRQSQKMEAVGQLAGGVAHDFNNILTAIFGQLDLAMHAVESEHPGARNILEGMQEIEQSAHRASTLTRQLLAFSRRQVTRPEVLDVNATLHNLEKMLRRLLTEDITLEQKLAKGLARTKADAGQLEQAIINLVVNARDAMPDGGRLTLETGNVTLDESCAALHPGARAGEHVVLVVSDTGHGMDQVTLERVFEPFFTTKPQGQGTGLGLSTVYGIVKQAGGHVTVYSEPGEGTSFRIFLPAVNEPLSTARLARSASATPGGTETLIICEDDTAVRDLTARALQGAGYNVLTATDGPHALELAAGHTGPLQLLVTDVIMPEMNGRQLSEALTKLRPEIRTLFVSGYTSNVIAQHGVLGQDMDFLEKPYSQRQLLLKIREILDRAATSVGPQRSES